MISRLTAGRGRWVIVPASSANLGCGFDCLAVALNLYFCARAEWGGHGFQLDYHGPHPDRIPAAEANLLVVALRRAAQELGEEPTGARIEVRSSIPVGVGLGSSAAARLAGILLACEAAGCQPEEEFVLRLGAALEGHADNVAAAWRGGLVAVLQTRDGRVRVERAAVPEQLCFVAVVPDGALPTERARAVLPGQYQRQEVVANLQRVALLTATCFSGRFALVPELFDDRIHQPYRADLVPGVADCLQAELPDVEGVFLSGAGPAVLAIVRTRAVEVVEQLAKLIRRHGLDAEVRLLKAENRGACQFWATGESPSLDTALGRCV